jgi:serine/threonine protein phosphatase PrpC
MKKNKENTNLPSSKEIKDQKSLFKSKTLHELLKQGGGQNLVIDFSMLSKKGNLNGLIERAKKYQNLNNPKIIEESTNENNKKKEYEEKNLKSSKISKNFEILTKFGKKKKDVNNMKNKENDFEEVDEVEEEQNKKKKNYNKYNQEKELINDLNKINFNNNDQDYTEETENTYQGCLELDYDNNQSDYSSKEKEKKSKKNYCNNNDNDNNNYNNSYYYDENNAYSSKKEKRVKFSFNNTINNNNQLLNNSRYLNQNQEQAIPNQNLSCSYNIPERTSKIMVESNQIRRPFVIEKNSNRESAKFMKKPQKKSKKYLPGQAIEYETVKENYSIKHCNTVLEYSFREDQNIDSEALMEDKSKSIENFNNDTNQMVFEIFDGHGGDEMSSYLQMNLAQIYKQNLLLNKGNIIISLKNAFRDADDEMRNQLNAEGLGSTGTLVHILWEKENDLVVYSANVGDSRVSLISPEHIIRLSYDHRTTDEKERKRILESGLEIIDDRINGTLMLTRIFGNYEYKNNDENEEDENVSTSNKGLICEPFISKINIDLSIENQYLILASDGIWDTITEEEIQDIILTNTDTQQICSIVIKKCLRNESWDNMSIFAIKLT